MIFSYKSEIAILTAFKHYHTNRSFYVRVGVPRDDVTDHEGEHTAVGDIGDALYV